MLKWIRRRTSIDLYSLKPLVESFNSYHLKLTFYIKIEFDLVNYARSEFPANK